MSFSKAIRAGVLALALLSGASLAGCSSFQPVYGDAGVAVAKGDFRYAAPQSKLDQIIYQDLLVKLGRSPSSTAPLVTVVATSETKQLGISDVTRPNTQRQAVVSGHLTITSPAGKIVFDTVRSATALYTTDSQGLADSSAQTAAEQQAAKELAEIIRMTILSSTGLKAN